MRRFPDMKGSFLTMLFIGVAASTSFGQSVRKPSFSAFPARVEVRTAKAINFRQSPEARTFRTRLSEALRGGVNFAGHYIVAGWGCGTGCISGAIIDARSGSVYWPKQFNALGVGDTENGYVDEPVAYRKNSRLLVITGSPGLANEEGPDLPTGEYYYEWRANSLHLIKVIPRKSN